MPIRNTGGRCVMRSAEEVRAAQVAEIRQAMERTQTAGPTVFYLDSPPPMDHPQLVDLRPAADSLSSPHGSSLWDRLTGGGS
jgi:hypothetical protein